ncbi:putative ribonuclease H protein [Nymphaea thermarum]|nr:putative ribonuclease H protein [Nymphaea thermarum]
MVAKSFSALFHHATVVGFLTPHSLFHLSSFSTLQYADDFLLFGSASRQQVVRTWLILRVFELISGLSINSAKCHLSLIHADPATVLLAEACFGCKATGLPMDYLGLQITLSSPAPSFWDGVEQKLTDRLQCWQGKLLSLSGRITLAKHCLASVPLHALSVFRPPVAVLRRFDKLIRKIIWDGDRPSDRLAHWDVVAFPRLLEGAGVTILSRACESSLCSWWWRLATEHSPITQFISSKFDLPSPSVWHSSISHTSPSHFWSDMLSVLPLFLRLADLSSSTSPSWPLSPTREFTFSSCYLASFGPSVASLPPRSLWSPGPSPRAIAFAWLLLTGNINTFDHLQRLGITWWRIWAERNNKVFRDTFSSPDSVARLVQGDVQFAIQLKRRCQSAKQITKPNSSEALVFDRPLRNLESLLHTFSIHFCMINFTNSQNNGNVNESDRKASFHGITDSRSTPSTASRIQDQQEKHPFMIARAKGSDRSLSLHKLLHPTIDSLLQPTVNWAILARTDSLSAAGTSALSYFAPVLLRVQKTDVCHDRFRIPLTQKPPLPQDISIKRHPDDKEIRG